VLRRPAATVLLALALVVGTGGATAGAAAAASRQDGTTATTERHLPRTNDELDQLDDGEHLDAVWVYLAAISCAVLVGGGGWWMKRRMDREARNDREREREAAAR
jgi:heme A synthase